jgi:adsorption protein B
MGQLPVFPLEMTPWKYWVGNTYVDEFTELHLKDMYAREEMGGVVPSAGVGTAFTRAAIEYLAGKNNGSPFKVGQLAEDYMVGLELCRSGYRAGFIDYPVEREVVRRRADGRETRKKITELVAVREHFPHKFFQSVKQKARWIIGTAFQGWEQGGWWGTPAIRYTLARDRKAPLVHGINLAGYCVAGYVLFGFGLSFTPWHQIIFIRPLIYPDSLLWRIV